MKKSFDEVPMVDASVDEYVSQADAVWIVSPGLEISSKRGLLKEGESVKVTYFKHGQVVLDDLIAKGFVVKK